MKLVSCIPSSLLPRAAVLALALFGTAAYADAYTAVEKLIQSGQSSLALEQLEAKIKDAPRDPQWRFLQGAMDCHLAIFPTIITLVFHESAYL